jgi:hypothetical protein
MCKDAVVMTPRLMLLIAPLIAAMESSALAQSRDRLCSERLSSYPGIGTWNTPTDQASRFEIRRCDGLSIQLAGFRAGENSPALIIDTEQPAVGLLIKTGTILFVQVVAGSSSPTYVLQMQKGTPTLVAQISGDGGAEYREEHTRSGDFAVFTVPLKTHPDATGKFPNTPPQVLRLKMFD